jgi:hypothetical protein
MSKQSEAKEKQGFRKYSPCCKNCDFFTFKRENVKSKYGNYEFTKESDLRCAIGNFKVGKSNYCNNHKFKESPIIDFTATPKRVNSNQI